MANLSISTVNWVRVALVFIGLIVGFAVLSKAIGWPDKDGWGLVVIIAIVIAALPLSGPIFEFLRESGAKVDIRGIKLDFSAAAAASTRGASVEKTNLEPYPGTQVNDSSAASIAESAEAALSAKVVVVDLGIGKSWYPTRLFALAAAAEDLHGARAIVLTAQHGGIHGRLIGWIPPRNVVEAFCASDIRYKIAMAHARTVLRHLQLSGGYNTYPFPNEYAKDGGQVMTAYRKTGDLAFVPALIARLQMPPANPDPFPDVQPDPTALEVPGEPEWLSREQAERLLDPWLIRDHIDESMGPAEQRKHLCRASGDYLAVVEPNGAYRGIVDINTTLRHAIFCASDPER